MEAEKRIEADEEIYSAESIQVLKGLEAVRRRPRMYIGDTGDGSGLHHMVWEVLDNATDEALAGHADKISLTLAPGGSITVEDNGRGIPVETHPREDVPFAQAVMTQLWSAGRAEPGAFQVCGGLRGVGVAVVNALSKRLMLTVWRGGKEYFAAFSGGEPQAPLKEVGKAQGLTGTRVKFTPDPATFANTQFDYAKLEQRLQELAFLNPGLRTALADLRRTRLVCSEFLYRNGLADYVRHLDRERTPLMAEPIVVKAACGGIVIEAALWWNASGEENLLCYTNTALQTAGGAHLMGLRAALTCAIGNYEAASGIAANGTPGFTRRAVRSGLTCVLSVKVPNSFLRSYPWFSRPGAYFSGAAKNRLVSPEVRHAVHDVMAAALGNWLREHPREAKLVLENIAGARKRIRDSRAKQLLRA